MSDLEALRNQAQQDIRELRQQIDHLDQPAIDLILQRARSHYAWQDRPVSEDQIKRLYEITKMGATSMNSCPARFVFVTSSEGKNRLA